MSAIKISKNQWEFVGRKAGWLKMADEEKIEKSNIPSVSFFRDNGSKFATVHDVESAFDLWRRHKWEFSVGNDSKRYSPSDLEGWLAIEKLFKK